MMLSDLTDSATILSRNWRDLLLCLGGHHTSTVLLYSHTTPMRRWELGWTKEVSGGLQIWQKHETT
jgi:hypothetical protein